MKNGFVVKVLDCAVGDLSSVPDSSSISLCDYEQVVLSFSASILVWYNGNNPISSLPPFTFTLFVFTVACSSHL